MIIFLLCYKFWKLPLDRVKIALFSRWIYVRDRKLYESWYKIKILNQSFRIPQVKQKVTGVTLLSDYRKLWVSSFIQLKKKKVKIILPKWEKKITLNILATNLSSVNIWIPLGKTNAVNFNYSNLSYSFHKLYYGNKRVIFLCWTFFWVVSRLAECEISHYCGQYACSISDVAEYDSFVCIHGCDL